MRALVGGAVTVLFPNKKISSRWNGALQARLRFAPLEAFLRSRGQRWAGPSATQVTDNLACATIHVLGAALHASQEVRSAPMSLVQRAAVGRLACAVSATLAALIGEPAYWRTAALVATARVLERHIGLSAAARTAAAAARDHHTAVTTATQDTGVIRIRSAVRRAVESNDHRDLADALQLMVLYLASIQTRVLETDVVESETGDDPPAGQWSSPPL